MSEKPDIKAVDIEAELAGLPVLDARSAETEEEADATFAVLGELGAATLFAGSFAGTSPWERHGRGDELVQILKGATRLTIIAADGPRVLELGAGMLTVVPQGLWHRFDAPDGVTVLTATPQPTDLHFDEEPPRME